ncbi:MAG: DEAD/DEAH box helicase [Acidobacteriota bacterium]|nr:DEAD/DEAH box helicase [Acidobacteriota bacterium]
MTDTSPEYSSGPGFPEVALSPGGLLYLEPPDIPGASPQVRRLCGLWRQDHALGLLELAGEKWEAPPSALLGFWRSFARSFLTALCQTPGIETDPTTVIAPPGTESLRAVTDRVPPMKGLEYLTPKVLSRMWKLMDAYAHLQAAAHPEGPAGWLREHDPNWRLVGRVTFHLAENKRNPEFPFAFMATYTGRLSDRSKPQYLPLDRALQEYAGRKNRNALLKLLSPVQAAAEKSPLIRSMVESGEIYKPQTWTPRDAYNFLREIPVFEESGIIVRVPDWWNGGRPPRPRVSVTIGEKRGVVLGLDTLLDFNIEASLDGTSLTEDEWRAIAGASPGLVSLRGQWIEVDPERLSQLMAHWKNVRKGAGKDGLSFLQAMRLLAGVEGPEPKAGREADTAEWFGVRAGTGLAALLEALRNPERLKATDADPGKDFRAVLRPYQREGVGWLHFLSKLGLGACLADDMGLGKTIQFLALLLLLRRDAPADSPPALLVVPASLVANWKAEIERFAPGLKVLYAHPSETPVPEWASRLEGESGVDKAGPELVITTYGILHRTPLFRKRSWSLIGLDEAQAVKNPATRQARAVKEVTAPRRIVLTGTPIENRLSDLWSIFDFLNPGLLGSERTFGQYAKSIVAGGPDAYGPLRALVRPYILRRLKTDKSIIDDLPDKTEVKAFCHLTPVQAALYRDMVRDLMEHLEERTGIERRGAVLAAILRFKQICNHPAHASGDGDYDPGRSGKFARLRDICEELAARQEKALVFTQFREIADPLADFLSGVFGRPGLVLHGGTPIRKRRSLVEEFQREDGPPFFILSLKAGGIGLNLTAAGHVIHFDRWWNPAVENQATDRAFRIGQSKNVMVHKFVCKGTIEEKIDALISEKTDLARGLIEEGVEKRLTEMSDRELLEFVALDIHRAAGE